MRTMIALCLSMAMGCDGGMDPSVDGGPGEPASRVARYIRADPDPRLVIELDYVAGAEPRAGAESDLVARLSALLDKPGGVEIVRDDVLTSRGADHAWTFEELQELAAETFDDDQPAGTVSMHVMWVDGHDAMDSSEGATLGLAWAHTHVAMYHDTIEDSCGGGPLIGDEICTEAQYLVWLHEVGHLIGLVDNGLPMVSDHRDPDRGAHDVREDCIMYWAFESRRGIGLLRERLLGGGTVDFDPACLADVAAARR